MGAPSSIPGGECPLRSGGPVLIDLAHVNIHGTIRYTNTEELTGLIATFRRIWIRPIDPSVCYNIFTDSDYAQEHLEYASMITSARRVLAYIRGSISHDLIWTEMHTQKRCMVALGDMHADRLTLQGHHGPHPSLPLVPGGRLTGGVEVKLIACMVISLVRSEHA